MGKNPSFGAEGAFAESFQIKITHIATDNSVSFYAFLNSFSDSFKGSYKTQNVYGRMDPIINYQGTTRKISFSFTVPAYSLEDSEENVSKIQKLIQFQYPTYNQATEVNAQGATTKTMNVSGMASPPMCKVKFNNLINYYGEELYGYFDGVDFTPTNESGYFISDDNRIFPKEFKITLSFNVLHTSPLGWDAATKKWGTNLEKNLNLDVDSQFPYGAKSSRSRANQATFNAFFQPFLDFTETKKPSELKKAQEDKLGGK